MLGLSACSSSLHEQINTCTSWQLWQRLSRGRPPPISRLQMQLLKRKAPLWASGPWFSGVWTLGWWRMEQQPYGVPLDPKNSQCRCVRHVCSHTHTKFQMYFWLFADRRPPPPSRCFFATCPSHSQQNLSSEGRFYRSFPSTPASAPPQNNTNPQGGSATMLVCYEASVRDVGLHLFSWLADPARSILRLSIIYATTKTTWSIVHWQLLYCWTV